MTLSPYKFALASLLTLSIGLPFVGLAVVVQVLFPALALAIGLYTLVRSPTRNYIQFVFIILMITPLIRRLVDWKVGRTDLSLIMIAPILVAIIAFLTLPSRWPRRHAPLFYSFLIYLVAVLWATMISVASGQIIPAVYALLTWIAPVALALHILSRSNHLDRMGETMVDTLIWGSALMAIYALFQFALAPPWDTAWIKSAGLVSVGRPAPFHIRVFSTMNSPGIFSGTMMIALLAILNRATFWSLISGIVIFLALGLSMVRGSWGGLVVGLILFLALGQARVKLRVISIAVGLALVAVPVVMQSSFFDSVIERASSLADLSDDQSFQDRSRLVENMLSDLPSLAMGHGIANTGNASSITSSSDESSESIDNGFLSVLFLFGTFAAVILCLTGIWSYGLFRAARSTPALVTPSVIALILFVSMLFSNKLPAPYGIFLFTFMTLSLAGYTQKRFEAKRNSLSFEHHRQLAAQT